LRDVIGCKERQNTDNEQRIKATDYDLFILQERAQELQKTAEIRDFDLKKTCEAYDVAHLDLLRARDE
jgi:hypothetical protein